MPYPDSAIVNSRGELLVGLSNGGFINAGKVVGPAGIRGESGLPGLRGEPGEDGLSCIAAFRAPSQDDGKEGDSWIDCSAAEFAFYKKSGNGWDRIANLRQPAKDLRVGAGAGSGGGTGGSGGTAQTTATLPLANPTRFKPAKSLPDSSGLKTQSDLNAWVYQCLLAGGSGGGDVGDLEERVEVLEKALMPWVEFTDNNRSCSYKAGSSYVDASVRMYQYWSVSSSGGWNWAWMVKFPGEEWVDIDDLDDETAASIGFRGDSTRDGVYVYLYPPDADDMIDIELSLKITNTVEGFEPAVGWSDSFWPRATWIGQGTADVSRSVKAKSGRGHFLDKRDAF